MVKIENLLKKAKSVEPISKDIETLAQQEIAELESMGIELKGLFSLLEPEALKIAKDYADFYIARYEARGKRLKEENPEKFEYLVSKGRYNPDGTLPEHRKPHQLRMGLTQKAFEIFLQQIQVPYIPNDPTIDWREKFLYDFYIPLFGKIDIKSTTLENPYVNINCREFKRENPDYVVPYMILDMSKPRWLKMLGYMYNSQVREYEPKGTGYRKYWKIPASDFEEHNGKRRDGEILLMRLMIVRHAIKLLDTRPIYELF